MKGIPIEQMIKDGGLGQIVKSRPDDFFIVCASYEPRTLGVATALSPEYRAKRAIIYFNHEFTSYEESKTSLEKHILELQRLLDPHCDEVRLARGSWLSAKEQLVSLRDQIVDKNSSTKKINVTLDATTFNREALLVTVLLLRANYSSNLRIAYSSPKKHGDWLSEGFRSVRNVMGFAGIQKPGLQTLLVILSGFEPERTLRLIEEHEPSLVFLGFGDPPTREDFLKRNLDEQETIITLAQQETKEFNFPANGIKDSFNCLDKLVETYVESHNIVVAPMSTKLSTLGVLLLAEKYPEIQITYGIPGKYNIDGYSKGVDEIFLSMLQQE